MAKIVIKLINTKSGIPVIKCVLSHGKKSCYAVIDTGSEMTVFDKSLGKNIHYMNEELMCSINGMVASGEQSFKKAMLNLGIKCAGNETLILYTLGYATEMTQISLQDKDGNEIPVSVIIGSDMLKHLDAKIDYEKNELRFML